jgi:RNA polymerase sigma factor (sigma-70 family)
VTTEQVKNQLSSYKGIKLERDHLATMVEELEADLYSLGSPNLDGMPHGGAGPGNPTANKAIKHADLRITELLTTYRQKLAELTDALTEIENSIKGLEPRERTLIRLYYAEGLTWEKVCTEIGYSWAQTHRIHAKALQKLAEIMEKAEETTPCD